MNKEEILHKMKSIIQTINPDTDVYLFGSRARRDSRHDSDWDLLLLVDADKVTNEIEDKYRDKLYDIELETGQMISIFIYPKRLWKSSLKNSPLYKNISKEGIRL